MEEIHKLEREAQYATGVADACSKMLAMFDNRLTEEIKDALRKERQSRREDAIRCLEEAVKLLENN